MLLYCGKLRRRALGQRPQALTRMHPADCLFIPSASQPPIVCQTTTEILHRMFTPTQFTSQAERGLLTAPALASPLPATRAVCTLKPPPPREGKRRRWCARTLCRKKGDNWVLLKSTHFFPFHFLKVRTSAQPNAPSPFICNGRWGGSS